ncbi:FG-GAP-like repeat-containing protein [Algicola sagamiensis]|uniref:FG-GAP-like repeat-containing protein n=1 Tax=Algicola sagamiensis TaxID=163869 RepID=UPI001B7FB499|nr:FG-GAP-like repeat-containing protein [Algicola sagamiensis]
MFDRPLSEEEIKSLYLAYMDPDQIEVKPLDLNHPELPSLSDLENTELLFVNEENGQLFVPGVDPNLWVYARAICGFLSPRKIGLSKISNKYKKPFLANAADLNKQRLEKCISKNKSLQGKALDEIIPTDADATADNYNSLEATQGQFRVNEMGQATYSIPFSLPDGIAGVKPQLGLSYSSSGGAGTAGWGWNVTGLSAITRCGSDFTRDGFQRGVMMDDKDHYCLDGQRLIDTGKGYYEKEVTDYSRIYKVGNGFRVETKAKETRYYGNTQTPYPHAYPRANYLSSYALQGFTDPFGNYVTFQYSSVGGSSQIKTIEYGGNYKQGVAPNIKVTYHYMARKKQSHGYRFGKRVSSTRVLENVKIEKDGAPYRFYEIKFRSSFADKNVVYTVRECINKNYQCRLPVKFDMTPKKSAGLKSQVRELGSFDAKKYSYLEYDLNGDHQLDGIEIPHRSGYTYFIDSKNGNQRTRLAYIEKSDTIQFLDANLDGTMDILYQGRGKQWYLAKYEPNIDIESQCNNPDPWTKLQCNDVAIEYAFHSTKQPIPVNEHFKKDRIAMLDVEGDGDLDLVYIHGDHELRAYLNHQGRFSSSSKTIASNLENVKKIVKLSPSGGDINGDGISDIALSVETYRKVSGVQWVVPEDANPDISAAGSTMKVCTKGVSNNRISIPGTCKTFDVGIYLGKVCYRVKTGRDSYGQACTNNVRSGDKIQDCYFYKGGRICDEEFSYESGVIPPKPGVQSTRPNQDVTIKKGSRRLNAQLIVLVKDGKDHYKQYGLDAFPTSGDVYFEDINSDGLSDVVYQLKKNSLSYQLSKGNGAFGSRYSLRAIKKGEEILDAIFADFDLDGKKELILNIKKTTSVRSGPGHDPYSIIDHFRYVTHSEIVERAGSHDRLKLSNEKKVYNNDRADRFYLSVQLIDTNHDGLPELSIQDAHTGKRLILDNRAQQVSTTPKLKTITTGYSWQKGVNLKTHITYLPMTDPAVYRRKIAFRNIDGSYRIDPDLLSPYSASYLVASVSSKTEDMVLGKAVEDKVSYRYEGMQIHRQGLGNLGFAKITSTDHRQNIRTTTEYSQARYTQGMPMRTTQKRGHTIVKQGQNAYQVKSLGRGIHQVFLDKSEEEGSSIDSQGQIHRLGKRIIENVVDKDGNTVRTAEITLDQSGETVHETRTTHTYGDTAEAQRYGRLSDSKVTKTQKAHTVAGVAQPASTITRKTAFTYYASGDKKGMLKSETQEPGTDKEETLTYDYDVYGNKVYTSTQNAESTKTTRAEFSNNGRYLSWTQDLLGHKTYHFYNGRSADEMSGPIYSKSVVTPAKLITTTYFSNYGLEIRTVYPDGTEKRTTKQYCATNCWGKALFKVTESKTGAADNVAYLDRHGRTVMTETTLFDGTITRQHTQYDADSRVVYQYQPSRNGLSSIWTKNHYDSQGRVIKQEHSNGAIKQFGYYGYITEVSALGQTQSEHIYVQNVKSALGHTIATFAPTTSSKGRSLGTVASRARVTKRYDAYGQLLDATTYAKNAEGTMKSSVVSVTYDNYGRKLTTTDPEKGTWTYTYDASGMLKTQTDANGNVKTLTYDPYGRLVQSTIPNWEGKTILTCQRYEDSQTPWVGSVVEESISEVEAGKTCADIKKSDAYEHRAYQFDHFGRATQTTTTLDKTKAFITGVTYDEFGRVATQIYPNGFTVRNEYADNGQLKSIYNAQSGELYQRVDAVDALGRVTKETVLGGVTRSKDFDAQRGWVKDIRISSNAHGDVYHVRYEHYENGSTKTRSSEYFDNTGASDNTTPFLSVEENFTFDKPFDRLTKRTVNFKTDILNLGDAVAQAQEFRYDGFGNMTSMTGAGEYVYDSDKPHRLAFIRKEQDPTKLRRFYYDASGNISWQSGEGEKHFYYSTRHKLRHLIANGVNSMFRYGLGNSRYYRRDIFSDHGGVYGSQTTYYVGKSYEKVWATGLKDKTGKTLPDLGWETYYVGSIAIKKFADGRDDTIRVMHSDALGSTTAVTDENGIMVSQSLFDPFGKRQDVIASSSKIDQYQPMEENRGFTGHEEINRTGIIHMNGRIYDMDVGRFMQADPFIQYPSDTQGYNRYAYVQNNPLKFTDPSGFFIKTIVKKVKKYWRQIVSIAALPVFGPVLGGMLAGYLSTGSLKGAIIGGFTGALGSTFGGLNGLTGFLSNGVVGGMSNKLMGGKFGHGFWSAGIGNTLGGSIKGLKSATGRIVAKAVTGGTISELTGGKFANGAWSAAFSASLAEMGDRHSEIKADPEDVQYAELSNSVYDENLKKGSIVGDYTVDDIFTDDNGLKAALFIGGDDSYVLAFAGTSPTSWANWKSNLLQAFGFSSPQHRSALGLAEKYYAKTNGNIHFTGHSLGGGIAAAAAIITGGNATVFNAAGVHNNTIRDYKRSNGSVKYYYSSHDLLRLGNNLTPSSVPGKRYNLGSAGAHGMGDICQTMGAKCAPL